MRTPSGFSRKLLQDVLLDAGVAPARLRGVLEQAGQRPLFFSIDLTRRARAIAPEWSRFAFG